MEKEKRFNVTVQVYTIVKVDIGGGRKEDYRRNHFEVVKKCAAENSGRAVLMACESVYRLLNKSAKVELVSCEEVTEEDV